MAKFSGLIGYVIPTKNRGVCEYGNKEVSKTGDFVRNTIRFQTGDKVNDDVTTSNEISITSDPFANENYMHIKYIVWRGVKWKVNAVEVKRPRLILSIGGKYNG